MSRRHGWSKVEPVQGCAEHLPFIDEAFDRVLIGGGVTYFNDPARALRASPPFKAVPRELRLLGLRWLHGGRFYLASFEKRA